MQPLEGIRDAVVSAEPVFRPLVWHIDEFLVENAPEICAGRILFLWGECGTLDSNSSKCTSTQDNAGKPRLRAFPEQGKERKSYGLLL